MPDTSSQNNATTVAAIYQELDNALKSTDELEGRLSLLESKLDELLAALEANSESDGKAKAAEGKSG